MIADHPAALQMSIMVLKFMKTKILNVLHSYRYIWALPVKVCGILYFVSSTGDRLLNGHFLHKIVQYCSIPDVRTSSQYVIQISFPNFQEKSNKLQFSHKYLCMFARNIEWRRCGKHSTSIESTEHTLQTYTCTRDAIHNWQNIYMLYYSLVIKLRKGKTFIVNISIYHL